MTIDRRLPWRVPWYLWVAFALALLVVVRVRHPSVLHGAALFAILAGLVLLVLVGAILWELPPAVMFCGAIALTLFSGNWHYLGLPGFPFVPDRLLLVTGLLALLLRSPGAADLPRLKVRPVHLLLLVTILYVVGSAALDGSLTTRAGSFDLLDRVGITPFLMLLVAPAVFPGPRERNWLLATLVGIGAYLGVMAVFETIGPHALVFPRYIRTLEIARHATQAVGPFRQVVTEGFACYACGVAAIIAFSRWRGAWRWVAAAVAFFALFGSFLSMERGVWIGTAAGAVAVALVTPTVRRWLIPAAAVGAVVLVGALTLIPALGTATSTRFSDNYPVWDRQNQTAAALRMIQTKPLFGFGWESWSRSSTPYFRLAPGRPLTGYPSTIGLDVAQPAIGPVTQSDITVTANGQLSGVIHDSYLSYAVELGLIGAGLWLASVLCGLGGTILAPSPPDLRPWRLGLLALTVCFFVLCAFDPLDQNFTELLLWTWAGVAAARGTTPPLRAAWAMRPKSSVAAGRIAEGEQNGMRTE